MRPQVWQQPFDLGFRIFFSFVGEGIQNGFLNTEADKQRGTRQTCKQIGIEAHREKGRQT